MTTPKHPDVEVQLIGTDGNAFAIVAKVRQALRRQVSYEAAEQYQREAIAGDYNHLLAVTQEWVVVT
ncbi:MAG: hypothetical protein F4Y26_05270 [Gammaproteobacteria bacterium]|nr:hypothetical protein [Gammaproteobacteria bacterium]